MRRGVGSIAVLLVLLDGGLAAANRGRARTAAVKAGALATKAVSEPRASVSPRVRGLNGQANLVLDVRSSLRAAPLRRRNAGRARTRRWLDAADKARLDARRIVLASNLSPGKQLHRLIAVVRRRMPLDPDAERRSLELGELQRARWGEARLSHYARKRVGECRERAFLLAAMLDGAGIEARVRYGVLYDRAGGYLGGHAWVEASHGGRGWLLDPSVRDAIPASEAVRLDEQLPNGRVRRVEARQTPDLLYVPTRDLSIISAPGSGREARSSERRRSARD